MPINFTRGMDLFPPLPTADPSAVGHEGRTMLIPIVHQMLANPKGHHFFPDWLGDNRLVVLCPVWEAAYYLCRRLIGWVDVGKGLQWFFRNQLNTLSDPRLNLLTEIWNRDNHLSMLAMWAWEHSNKERDPNDFMGPDFYRVFTISLSPGPYGGGTNPLHIGHCMGGEDLSTDLPKDDYKVGQNLLSDKKSRRATLMVDHMRFWPQALQSAGKELPDLGGRSWHVDVIVNPVGWLGTFRQSRLTKFWFQGKHSIHEAGWN